MDLVVGTYEKLLLGYKLSHSGDAWSLELKFTNNAHTGAVKVVAISQKGILASGSTDETIHLFNLRKNVELGSLASHSGTIAWLEFIQGGHLLSASADSSFALWRHFTWQPIHTFHGHKAAVNCVSLHPSSKLALSVSSDKTVRTWDMTNMRSAYVTTIKEAADIVQWSPDGSEYIIVCNDKIHVYTIKDCKLELTIKSTKRINCVVFLDAHTLVYGGEGGQLTFYNLANKKQIHQMDTETVRVRGLVYKDNLLITASSDGTIKVYQPTILENSVTMKQLLSHNTQFRLLCLAVSSPTPSSSITNKGPKLKSSCVHKVEEDESSEEEVSDSGADVESEEDEADSAEEEEDSSGQGPSAESSSEENDVQAQQLTKSPRQQAKQGRQPRQQTKQGRQPVTRAEKRKRPASEEKPQAKKKLKRFKENASVVQKEVVLQVPKGGKQKKGKRSDQKPQRVTEQPSRKHKVSKRKKKVK